LLRQLTEAEINSAILLAPAQIERASQVQEREQNRNALAR
jgi:hypothetical protein